MILDSQEGNAFLAVVFTVKICETSPNCCFKIQSLIAYPVRDIHPPKQTWNLKMDPWKMRFLLETIISRFHVNFWGCKLDLPP